MHEFFILHIFNSSIPCFESQEICVCIRSHFRFTTNPTFAIVYARSLRRHADSQHDLRTIQHHGSFAKAAGEQTASPLKESPARDEEDETSDCPMEQVADQNPSASQQPENVNMEQVD